MSLFASTDPSETIARVRYTEFSKPEQLPGLRTRSLKKKRALAPSGHQYTFRQQGRPTNSNSQWLPIRRDHAEDADFFEEREGFEVTREG